MLRKLAITLWSGTVVDAGDATDIELPVALAALLAAHSPTLSIDDLMRLQNGIFILTLGTETGAGDFTVDSFSVSRDGTTYRIVESLNGGSGYQYTAPGEYQIPISQPMGFAPAYIRLDATVAQLTADHKFAASKLELQGNISVPA